MDDKIVFLMPETLVLLPHFEAEADAHGLSTNCYAFVTNRGVVLVDAVFADTLPQVLALVDQGCEIAALAISHRHVVAQADALPELLRRFDIPVFLHPIDANHPQTGRWRGLPFQNPMQHALLREAGLQATHVPGHTEGHIMLYASGHQILLAGDCATGSPNGVSNPTLLRPPVFFNTDDGQLREEWVKFQEPVASICPYHGRPLIENRHAVEVALASLRRLKTTTALGK